MYYNELKMLIEKVVYENIDRALLSEYMIDMLDCEKIYDCDDMLTSDAYFDLLHHSFGEEEIRLEEWQYFLECFAGKRKYDMEEKMRILRPLYEK